MDSVVDSTWPRKISLKLNTGQYKVTNYKRKRMNNEQKIEQKMNYRAISKDVIYA